MKKIFLLLLTIITSSIFWSCEIFLVQRYPIQYVNNSEHVIYVYNALSKDLGAAYPDTTLSMARDIVKVYVKANNLVNLDMSFPMEYFISNLPQDTLSIYIFSADTLSKYSWEQIRQDYNILQRYDLSIEDIQTLDYSITYPPTKVMKNMKMYPPYGEYENH